MRLESKPIDAEQIQACRELYRQEMNCQIIHDSIHARPGWTVEYLLTMDGSVAGYGSLAIAGPWKNQPTLYEFFLLPEACGQAFELFEALVKSSGAKKIETQTNDRLLTLML